jgi:uncharacterized membrane protein YbhN (UPF0104 family)
MKHGKRFASSLRWALAAFVMAFVARQLLRDPAPLVRIVDTAPSILLGLCSLVVVNQALMSVRFSLAMRHTGQGGVSLWAWFRLVAVGQMLNLFVPQLGTIQRGVALKRDYGISYIAYASALVAFVWLDLVMGLAIAALAIALLDPQLRFAGISALILLSFGAVVLVVGPPLAALVLSRLSFDARLLTRLHERLLTLLRSASTALRSPQLLARFFVLNVLVSAGQTATLWLAFQAVGASVGWPTLILFQILIKLSGQIVVTPGNLGITELAFGALARGAAATLEQGLAVSLLLRGVGSLMVIALGVAFGGAQLLHKSRRAELPPVSNDDISP